MLTGESPFLGEDKQETFLNVSQVNVDYSQDVFHGISSLAVDFIQSLLHKNPRYVKKEHAHFKFLCLFSRETSIKMSSCTGLERRLCLSSSYKCSQEYLDWNVTASKPTGPVTFPRSPGARLTHSSGHFLAPSQWLMAALTCHHIGSIRNDGSLCLCTH